MTDLAAEGDRLYAEASQADDVFDVVFATWAEDNWPAIAAALRERDTTADDRETIEEIVVALCRALDWEEIDGEDDEATLIVRAVDALRIRAETAEADADRLVDALKALWKAIIVVKTSLTDPYPDDKRWSPWTRFIEGPRNAGSLKQAESALAAHAAAVEARA